MLWKFKLVYLDMLLFSMLQSCRTSKNMHFEKFSFREVPLFQRIKVRESISLHILACIELKRFMVCHQKFPKKHKNTTVIPDDPLKIARPQKLELRQ